MKFKSTNTNFLGSVVGRYSIDLHIYGGPVSKAAGYKNVYWRFKEASFESILPFLAIFGHF